MFKIKANFTLDDTFRKIPITGNNYRPLLFFSNTVVRSGLINMKEGESLQMNQTYNDRLISIYVYKDLDVDKEFYVGKTFVLAEGGQAVIGKGIITEVIGSAG